MKNYRRLDHNMIRVAELLVPLLCALAFVRRGATTAVAFCLFWTAENLLYIAAYMGDARRAEQPLVGGDESDWEILFTHWGVLHMDRTIAAWMRALGWIGMLMAIGWLGWMYVQSEDRRDMA